MLDLTQHPVPAKKEKQPSAWLREINPRPPGIQAADSIKHTYGGTTGVVPYSFLFMASSDFVRFLARLRGDPSTGATWCICRWSCGAAANRAIPVSSSSADDRIFGPRFLVVYICAKGQRVSDPGVRRSTWIPHSTSSPGHLGRRPRNWRNGSE
jgi:hypothetical protein